MNKNKNGITLVALVVTIIILLILAGISISALRENGILRRAQEGGVEYEKAQLKEELELEIQNIRVNKLLQGKDITREDLMELEKIGVVVKTTEIPAEGEYNDYFFEVDENYMVTIIGKLEGEKPSIQAEIITTGIVEQGGTVEIKVTANIDEGNIASIQATNGATLKTDISATEKLFEVSKNGTYYFKAKADNGRTAEKSVVINTIIEKPQISIKDETTEGFTIVVNNNYPDELITEYKYYVAGELKLSGTQNKQHIVTGLAAGQYTNIYVEVYIGENKLTSEKITGNVFAKKGKLTEIVAATDYGKNINYSVTVKGTTLSDWKVFYNDNKNVYLILGGYLKNTLVPDEIKATKNSIYDIYWESKNGVTNATQAVSTLTNTNFWQEFAQGKNAVTATGGPTSQMFVNSWNSNPVTNSRKLTVGTMVLANNTSPLKDSSKLYIPYNGYDVSGCVGYRLASIYTDNTNIWAVNAYGNYATYSYSNAYIGLRPVICLDSETTGGIASSVIMD